MIRRLFTILAKSDLLPLAAAAAAAWGVGQLTAMLQERKVALTVAHDELIATQRVQGELETDIERLARLQSDALSDYDALMEKRGQAYRRAVVEAERNVRENRSTLLPTIDAPVNSADTTQDDKPQPKASPTTLANTSKRANVS